MEAQLGRYGQGTWGFLARRKRHKAQRHKGLCRTPRPLAAPRVPPRGGLANDRFPGPGGQARQP
jgi:hypothetical protein